MIFNNLGKKKSLNIVKCNNYIKKKIDININDYKEYSEIYSSIEIEIKKVDNKCDKFINIIGEEKYYHIYFNDNKKEIKRNHINKNEKIKIIKIILDYQVKSFRNLFFECDCIESIYFKKFYRNNINDMSYMFYKCSSLKELNLNNFNTTNVTKMNSMFYECSELKNLNLKNFDTKNVIDMSNMFYRCKSLNELNLDNFNTNKVTNMNKMFSECSSLIKLNLKNFKTNNVTDMNYMFSFCFSLTELNLENFNINNETYDMFLGCSDKLIMKIRKRYKNINKYLNNIIK